MSLFITFEGIDGSGKTTMLNRLAAYLKSQSHDCLSTLEPGGSALGQNLRQILLNDSKLKPSCHAEALLFAADRAVHIEQIIKPALAKGQIVLCDRFIDSTLAYQGGGRGLDMAFLEQLNNFATANLKPDITFYFDLPLNIARQRQNAVLDKMEQEAAAFFDRVLATYRQLAMADSQRIKTIDASQDQDQVFAALLAHLKATDGWPA